MREMNSGFLIFGFSEDDETLIFVGVAASAEAAFELCAEYQTNNPEMYVTVAQGILMRPQSQD